MNIIFKYEIVNENIWIVVLCLRSNLFATSNVHLVEQLALDVADAQKHNFYIFTTEILESNRTHFTFPPIKFPPKRKEKTFSSIIFSFFIPPNKAVILPH